MNNMKKVYAMILLTASLFTTSCSDWLDVAPSNQVNGDKLFEVGDGYRNALNGIYLNLGTSSMYGKSISWGFMDVIAQYYQSGSSYMKSTSSYYKAANYKFDDSDVKSIISSIWSVGYNNIANCNNLIANVSEAFSFCVCRRRVGEEYDMGRGIGIACVNPFRYASDVCSFYA